MLATNHPLHVNLGQRYCAAWSEINARIQSRQMVNIFFVTATLALNSLFIKDILAIQSQGVLTYYNLMTVSLVWCYCLWIRHHENLIGILGLYCKTIERCDNKDCTLPIPSFHDDSQELIIFGRNYRKYTDIATTIVICLSLIIVCYTAYKAYSADIVFFILDLIILIPGFFAIIFVFSTTKHRKRIAYMEFKEISGKWKFVDSQQNIQKA